MPLPQFLINSCTFTTNTQLLIQSKWLDFLHIHKYSHIYHHRQHHLNKFFFEPYNACLLPKTALITFSSFAINISFNFYYGFFCIFNVSRRVLFFLKSYISYKISKEVISTENFALQLVKDWLKKIIKYFAINNV